MKDATLEHAVQELSRQILGKEWTDLFSLVAPDYTKTKRVKVTLNLKNVKTSVVLDYLCELSGCAGWDLKGREYVSATLCFHDSNDADDGVMTYIRSGPLSAHGAAMLGIKTEMTHDQMKNVFSGLGVVFDPAKEHTVLWEPRTETLAVRANRTEVAFALAVARLANNGVRIEAGKKSSTRNDK